MQARWLLILGGEFFKRKRKSIAFFRPVHELKISLLLFSWQKEKALMISKAYPPV